MCQDNGNKIITQCAYFSGLLWLLVVCSLEEAGRYLETYKSFESKPPDLIMEKSEGTYMSQVHVGMLSYANWACVCVSSGSVSLIVSCNKDSANVNLRG